MPELPGLFAKLRLDSRQWEAGLRAARTGVQTTSRAIETQAGRMTGAFQRFGVSVKNVAGDIPIVGGALQQLATPAGAVSVGIGSVAIGLAAMVNNLRDTEAALRPAIERSRIGAESLQALAESAKLAGSEDGLEAIVDTSQELQLQLGELALTGNARAVPALDALGLKAQELQAMKPEEAWRLVVEQIQRIPNAADKATAAEEIFGGTSEKLAGIINLTNIEFAQLESHVRQTARILDEETLGKVRELNIEMTELNAQMGQTGTDIAVDLLPALIDAAQGAQKGAQGFGFLWEQLDTADDAFVRLATTGSAYRSEADLMGEASAGVAGLLDDMAQAAGDAAGATMEAGQAAAGDDDSYASRLAKAIEETEAANEALREENQLAMDVAAAYGELPSVIDETTWSTEELTEATEALEPAMTGVTEAAGELGMTLAEYEDQLENNKLGAELLSEANEFMSGTFDQATTTADGTRTGADRLREALASLEAQTKATTEAEQAHTEAMEEAKEAADAKADAIAAAEDAVADYNEELENARIAEGDVEAATAKHQTAVENLDDALVALNLVMEDKTSTAEDVTTALVAWKTAVDDLATAQRLLEQATRAATAAAEEQAGGTGGGGGGGGDARGEGERHVAERQAAQRAEVTAARNELVDLLDSGNFGSIITSAAQGRMEDELYRLQDRLDRAGNDPVAQRNAYSSAASNIAGITSKLRAFQSDSTIDTLLRLMHFTSSREGIFEGVGYDDWDRMREILREKFPHLAGGGIAMPKFGGTIARLAEAGVPEAVIPLDRLPSVMAQAMGVGRGMGSVMMPGGDMSAVIENRIEVELNGQRMDDWHVRSHTRLQRTGRE